VVSTDAIYHNAPNYQGILLQTFFSSDSLSPFVLNHVPTYLYTYCDLKTKPKVKKANSDSFDIALDVL
jgi:hypothetical protein